LNDFILFESISSSFQDSKLILFLPAVAVFHRLSLCSWLAVFIWKEEGFGVLVLALVRSCSGLIFVYY
jgi:hypothetical protein